MAEKGEIIKVGFCDQANRSVLTVSMNISMRTVTAVSYTHLLLSVSEV